MKTYRSELSLSDMEMLAYDFGDEVAGRALLLPGDTVQLHADVLQRVGSYTAFKSAVGSETYSPTDIEARWSKLHSDQQAVDFSGAVLLRSGEAIRQAEANLRTYRQSAATRKEHSVRMLMDILWEHVGEPTLDVIDAVKPVTAVDVMQHLRNAFDRWKSKSDLEGLRSEARQDETSIVAVAPDISERMAKSAQQVAELAPEQRLGLMKLLRKSGRQV